MNEKQTCRPSQAPESVSAIRRQLALSLLASGLVPTAWAQGQPGPAYPNRPIRVIVPLNAGSATDGTARFIATALSKEWGVPVVVDNKPGAGVIVGTEMAAKSPADGHTLLFTYASHYSQPWVQPTPYDAVHDFEGVAQLANTPLMIAVGANSAFRSVADVIAAAKRRPGSISYASAGVGTTGHMAGALFESLANVSLNHVPYKSASQVAVDTASGQADLMFGGFSSGMGLVRSGKLRVLAVTSAKRSGNFPEIPTLAELGLNGYENSSPIWMLAPRGTPQPIVAKISEALVRIASSSEFKEACQTIGADPDPRNAAYVSANAPVELAKWKRLVELTKPSSK